MILSVVRSLLALPSAVSSSWTTRKPGKPRDRTCSCQRLGHPPPQRSAYTRRYPDFFI